MVSRSLVEVRMCGTLGSARETADFVAMIADEPFVYCRASRQEPSVPLLEPDRVA